MMLIMSGGIVAILMISIFLIAYPIKKEENTTEKSIIDKEIEKLESQLKEAEDRSYYVIRRKYCRGNDIWNTNSYYRHRLDYFHQLEFDTKEKAGQVMKELQLKDCEVEHIVIKELSRIQEELERVKNVKKIMEGVK